MLSRRSRAFFPIALTWQKPGRTRFKWSWISSFPYSHWSKAGQAERLLLLDGSQATPPPLCLPPREDNGRRLARQASPSGRSTIPVVNSVILQLAPWSTDFAAKLPYRQAAGPRHRPGPTLQGQSSGISDGGFFRLEGSPCAVSRGRLGPRMECSSGLWSQTGGTPIATKPGGTSMALCWTAPSCPSGPQATGSRLSALTATCSDTGLVFLRIGATPPPVPRRGLLEWSSGWPAPCRR